MAEKELFMLRFITSKLSVKLTVPLLLTIPVLIVVVILSTVAYRHSRATADDLASQNLSQIHDAIGRNMDAFLWVPSRINRVNESLIRQGKLDPDDLRGWRETFFAEAEAFDMVSAVVWGSEEGHTTWVALYAGDDYLTFTVKDDRTDGEALDYRLSATGEIGDTPIATYPFDPRVRPWYVAPMRAGEASWSEPYGWIDDDGGTESGTLGIGYGLPYRNGEGQIIGVVNVDLSLQDISVFLASLSVGKTGQAFVIDREGLLIATSTDTPVVSAACTQLPAVESSNEQIAQAMVHVTDDLGALDAINSPYQSTLTVDSERYMLMVSPFQHETGLSWLIVTVVPEADFLAEVQAGGRRSMFVGLAAVVGTVLLGIFVAVAMVRPIVSLVAHVRHIGQGNLDSELHLTQASEMVQLSDEINDMMAGLRDRLKMRAALAMAMAVQQSLLPTRTPTVSGLDIAGHSTYCDETGGDYYDYLNVMDLSDSGVAIAVGDVVGHGVAAAMMMATARGILVSRCNEPGSLADLLTHLNRHLARDVTNTGRFMTMLLLTLDAERNTGHWTSAGHDAPIVYDPQDGTFAEAELGGLPLGVMDDEIYKEHTFDNVRTGQIYFVGTDGIWEMMDGGGDEFGKDRLRELIRENAHRSADEISNCLRDELAAYLGESKQEDDVTFVVVKVG
jgi:phosphoserine phosphatase RsbU/P